MDRLFFCIGKIAARVNLFGKREHYIFFIAGLPVLLNGSSF